jgi:hypothetical protein
MEPKEGDLYEVSGVDENVLGQHAIYDLDKWLSDDSDWDSASRGNFLTPGETLVFLGEIRPGVDHATEFGLFLTRFGKCWVAFGGCHVAKNG